MFHKSQVREHKTKQIGKLFRFQKVQTTFGTTLQLTLMHEHTEITPKSQPIFRIHQWALISLYLIELL